MALVIALTVALVVTAVARQHILRHRAEALYTDFKGLTLRKTTFQGAQPFLARWKRWGTFAGPCTPARCVFSVALSSIDNRFDEFIDSHDRVFDLAARFGIHPAGIGAHLVILNSVLWGEAINFWVDSRVWSDGKPYVEAISGSAFSNSELDRRFDTTHWRSHPEYTISWPGNQQNELRFEFTPFADPNDVHRLTQMDFSCLTRTVSCTDKAEIMPTAVAQSHAWAAMPGWDDTSCDDPQVLFFLARESTNVVIARAKSIVRLYAPLGSRPFYGVELAFEQFLKGRGTHPNGQSLVFQTAADSPAKVVPRVGERVFLFFNEDDLESAYLAGCAALPVTDRYLSPIEEGIEADTRPSGLFSYDLIRPWSKRPQQ
ncbi:MAG TPA: hypothetical protein VMB47_14640 [Candidatus Aquilonibacter sp.]|nr:hypothetical protein [Candidatus Aquilonibacter sp.]